MFTVYILKSTVTAKSYVGVTNDILRRINEHNAGKHAYTKIYRPWSIIHQEVFGDFATARAREKYLKSASGRKFLKKLFD